MTSTEEEDSGRVRRRRPHIRVLLLLITRKTSILMMNVERMVMVDPTLLKDYPTVVKLPEWE